jgi:hypothetical protein
MRRPLAGKYVVSLTFAAVSGAPGELSSPMPRLDFDQCAKAQRVQVMRGLVLSGTARNAESSGTSGH